MTISASVVLLTCILFLADKAVGGVASEYGKRIWFKVIEPFVVGFFCGRPGLPPATHTDPTLADKLTDLNQEVDYLKKLTEDLITERDALLLENIQLRIEKYGKSAG